MYAYNAYIEKIFRMQHYVYISSIIYNLYRFTTKNKVLQGKNKNFEIAQNPNFLKIFEIFEKF